MRIKRPSKADKKNGEVDRGGRSRNPVIVKHLSIDKLTREKSDL